MKLSRYAIAAAIALLAAVPALAAGKSAADLKAAYLGETTAHAKYVAYAKKAEAEGYRSVAALFRAASLAESVHARNHKKALADLGVKNPKAGSYTATPGTTAANLKDAIKGETYEKDTMYPGMIKDATAEKKDGALMSFNYAISAERQHAALYTAALKSLSKKPAGIPYYVCPVCGATFQKTAPAACPTCATPRERFTKIS